VPELIQNACYPKNILAIFKKWNNQEKRVETIKNYTLLEKYLGGAGASSKAADIIYKLAKS